MRTTALVILLVLSISLVYCQNKPIRKRTSTTYTYHYNGDKVKRNKRIDNYIVYDKKGNEIKYATYGEVSEGYSVSDQGNATISDRWNNSNIFTCEFTTYYNNQRKMRVDTWLYHDNQKYELWDYCIFKYNDQGLLIKQITFTPTDTIKEIETCIYDKNLNKVRIIDSSFKPHPNVGLSVVRTENQFDERKRLILTTMFSDEKFLLRKKFFYNGSNRIEWRYDNESDNSLWSTTETSYQTLNQSTNSEVPLEICWQTANPVDWSETDQMYFHNTDGRLEKIESYNKGKLTEVTKFTYKYY